MEVRPVQGRARLCQVLHAGGHRVPGRHMEGLRAHPLPDRGGVRVRGYGGHILHVDVSTGEALRTAMDPEVARLWLGGAGLGAYLVYTLVSAGADPL
ncbi:MAG: hypothetical protein GQ558_08795, partial [Thermoplasmata archaeon]|nr:hypothetical protein [Thermoplasmata archaeon]